MTSSIQGIKISERAVFKGTVSKEEHDLDWVYYEVCFHDMGRVKVLVNVRKKAAINHTGC